MPNMRRKKTAESRVLGQAIRETRRGLGLTQADLAVALKTDRASVCHIEAGRRDIRVTQLCRVARRLRTTVRALVASLDSASV